MSAYDILDDFAGPGGWDEGARTLGLRSLGIEKEPIACTTATLAGHARLERDVESVPHDILKGRFVGYLASPPCPDFSTAGSGAGEAGDSGRLVRFPLERALALRPEWLAWEQVSPVLPIWRECAVTLRAAGYSVWTGVLNAANYGAPQDRLRAVLLASRVRAVSAPSPSHAADTEALFGSLAPHLTLADALGLDPGWEYDSGQNSVLGGGRIERYVRSCDRPAGTLTTKAASQWVLRKGDERRKLTTEEAAMLQTFPVDYPWQGTREQRLTQIGNAVPPLLAAHILSAVTGHALEMAA